jgi:hypothetical protein
MPGKGVAYIRFTLISREQEMHAHDMLVVVNKRRKGETPATPQKAGANSCFVACCMMLQRKGFGSAETERFLPPLI